MVATHTSDGKKRKVTDTDTTNLKSPHKLLINRIIPDIIPVVILPVHQMTADRVAASVDTLHAVRTVLSKNIITDAACSAAHVFKDTLVVNWKYTYGAIPWDRNTFRMPPEQLPQFGLVLYPWSPQVRRGSKILEVQGGP